MRERQRTQALLLPITGGALLYFVAISAFYIAYTRALAPPDEVLVVKEMRFTESDSTSPPLYDTHASTVHQLPDDWFLNQPETRQGWYESVINLNVPPSRLWGIYFPSVNMNAAVYLNGSLLGHGGRFEDPVARNWNRPLYFAIPNGFLLPGENILQVNVKTDPPGFGMLERIYLGPEELLSPAYDRRYSMRVTNVWAITIGMVVISIMMGGVWLFRRQDTLYGWFALMTITWAIHTANLLVVDIPVSTIVWDWASFVSLGWFVIFLIITVHRFLHEVRPRLETMLFAGGLAGSGLLAFAEPLFGSYFWPCRIWSTIVLLTGLYPAWHIVSAYLKRPRLEILFVIPAGLLILGYAIHDWLILMGLWERQGGYIMQYSAPVVLLVFAAVLLARFVNALNESEQLNLELEQRVEEKRIQLEANFNRLNKLEQERALGEERERIMRDMHDGVGGHLVSTLALVQSGGTNKEEVSDSLQSALSDLRLMIDSLDPVDNDLPAVLGMFRTRMQPMLEHHGLTFNWQVTDLPSIPGFGPQRILQVLRILQEAVTNVIKHARAQSITVRTGREQTDESGEGVFIEVRDDGIGIQQNPGNGKGLANMRYRAQSIGAGLDVDSGAAGTSICIHIPLSGS